MHLEDLQELALRISSERRADVVLQHIVKGLAEQSGVALARVWVVQPDDHCEVCRTRAASGDDARYLHLAASAGSSLAGESWSKTNGDFHRIPVGRLKVGSIASDRTGIRIDDPTSEKWRRPEWVRAEGIATFVGQPLVFDGDVLGVLAVFRREPIDDHEFRWLRMFADQAASALANARAFSELQRQQQQLELLDGLLGTLSTVLDVRQVFEQVSGIARRVIAHDAMTLLLVNEDRAHVTRYAATTSASQFPETVAIPEHRLTLLTSPWDHLIDGDIQSDPQERLTPPGVEGYRARLMMPIRVAGQGIGVLVFLSRSADVYTQADVIVARRIVDHVALALSHDRLAEEAQRVAEAKERAAVLERRVTVLTAEVDALGGHRRVVGPSKAWRDVLKQATQVASTDTTVLLLGESGTGKEVVARFIHRASGRNNGPFVAINCAALPEQLLESELFGHERGAFTGAMNAKPGQLELAASGVLFLDEVSEMSLTAQAKFLRVLQEREFQRLGGTKVMKTNVRVVAASNRDLHAAIARGTFREDLYYRLGVFEISLPRLRDRPEDILPLSQAFLEAIGRAFGRPPAGISRDAKQRLLDYHWPGNVRQLRNTLERAAIVCEGGLITGDHLSLPSRPAHGQDVPARPATVAEGESHDGGVDLKTMERAAIEKALQDAKFNKSRAAKLLGLTRTQLYVRLRKYGME